MRFRGPIDTKNVSVSFSRGEGSDWRRSRKKFRKRRNFFGLFEKNSKSKIDFKMAITRNVSTFNSDDV